MWHLNLINVQRRDGKWILRRILNYAPHVNRSMACRQYPLSAPFPPPPSEELRKLQLRVERERERASIKASSCSQRDCAAGRSLGHSGTQTPPDDALRGAEGARRMSAKVTSSICRIFSSPLSFHSSPKSPV